jgi:Periplasmic binding protein domain
MDAKTHHLFKPVMIGRITDDGRIVPVSVTEGLVPPDPWSPWLQRPGLQRSGLKRPGSAAPAGAAPELRQAAGE